MPDPQQSALKDRYCPGQAVRDGEGSQVADCLADRGGRLIGQAEHDDAGMAAGRVGADVAQSNIQGDEDPFCRGGGGHHFRVRRAGQSLLANGVDIMTGAGQNGGRRDRQVLVRA